MTADPFEVLGLEPRLLLDEAELAERHRQLSATLHPDRHGKKGAAERRVYLLQAMAVNEAFRLLRDPARRAEALLSRLGVDTLALDRLALPPSFLMEMMEQREELAAHRQARNVAAIDAIEAQLRGSRQAELASLETLLVAWRAAGTSADPHPLLLGLARLRYLQRFREEVLAAQQDLDEAS